MPRKTVWSLRSFPVLWPVFFVHEIGGTSRSRPRQRRWLRRRKRFLREPALCHLGPPAQRSCRRFPSVHFLKFPDQSEAFAIAWIISNKKMWFSAGATPVPALPYFFPGCPTARPGRKKFSGLVEEKPLHTLRYPAEYPEDRPETHDSGPNRRGGQRETERQTEPPISIDANTARWLA